MISSMRGGGSEQQTALLLRHLDRERFVPHLYVLERTGELLADLPADVKVHSLEDAPPKHGVYYPGKALARQSRHVGHTLVKHSIDVVYDRTFHMTMIAAPAAHALGIPRVSTIVSPPDRALPMVESRFVMLKRMRLAKAYRRASQVIAVSEQAAESAAGYYDLKRESMEVIPNPVDGEAVRRAAQDTAAIDDASEGSRANVATQDTALEIVCVGRMTHEKGQMDLLDAIVKVGDSIGPIHLNFVGDGPRRAELEQRAESVWPGHRVRFLGQQENAVSWIHRADALVLPSHFEGMPNVVLEAMTLGVPVIATRAGGTVELERDEPTILWAEPADPASLARAITNFVNDREAANQRATHATTMVNRFHDVRQTVQRIQHHLEATAKKRR